MIGFVAPNGGGLEGAATHSSQAIFKFTGRNIGNLAFWYSARRLIDEPLVYLNWSTKPSDVPHKLSAIVIPAANFIGAHTHLAQLANLVRSFDLPVVVVGLGAQSERADVMPPVPEGTADFLREVAKRTPFIAVRGEFTKAVCATQGIDNVVPIGCPSVLMNGDRSLGRKVGRAIDTLQPTSVGVHAASTKGNVQSVERELFRWMRLFPGSQYIVQRPAEIFAAIMREELTPAAVQHLASLAAYLGVEGGADAMARELQTYGYIPTSIDSWRVHLRRHSCTVNTRIHGTMVGLQTEVPSLCVAHDARIEELCHQMAVPMITVKQFIENRYDVSSLFKLAAFDPVRFEARRTEAARIYVQLLQKAGVKPSAHLLSFINEPAQSKAA